jgi:hypothetical protein
MYDNKMVSLSLENYLTEELIQAQRAEFIEHSKNNNRIISK